MENLIQIFRRPWSSIKAYLYLFILLLPILLSGLPSYAEEDKYDTYFKLSLLLLQGGVNLGVGEFQEAINSYDKALEIDPKLAEAWSGKGEALSGLGRNQEAIDCHDKALEIDPEYAQAWYNKGVVLKALGKKDEAEGCFGRAKELGLSPAEGK